MIKLLKEPFAEPSWEKAGILVLSLVSCGTTTMGVRQVLSDMAPPWDLAFALTLTFAIQVLLVKGVLRAVSPGAWLGRVVAALMLPPCWAFSVVFAFSFWWQQFRADDYAKETYNQGIESIAEPLLMFASRYDDMTRNLEGLAAYSKEQAEEEHDNGGTCGDGSSVGNGPRTRLRMNDKERFASFSEHFARRRHEAAKLSTALLEAGQTFEGAKFDSYRRKLVEGLGQAKVLHEDPRLASLKTFLTERLKAGRVGFKTEAGVLIRCPDPYLEEHMQQLLGSLVLPKLPAKAPRLHRPTHKESIRRVFDDLFETLVGFAQTSATDSERGDRVAARRASLKSAPAPAKAVNGDFGMLLLASFIDVLLVCCAILEAVRRGRRFDGPEGFVSLSKLKGRLSEEFVNRLQGVLDEPGWRITELLHRFEMRNRWRTQVIVPVDRLDPDARRIARLMTLLEGKKAARLVTPRYPKEKLPRWWREMHGDGFGAEYVRVYQISPTLLADLLMEELAARRPPYKQGPELILAAE